MSEHDENRQTGNDLPDQNGEIDTKSPVHLPGVHERTPSMASQSVRTVPPSTRPPQRLEVAHLPSCNGKEGGGAKARTIMSALTLATVVVALLFFAFCGEDRFQDLKETVDGTNTQLRVVGPQLDKVSNDLGKLDKAIGKVDDFGKKLDEATDAVEGANKRLDGLAPNLVKLTNVVNKQQGRLVLSIKKIATELYNLRTEMSDGHEALGQLVRNEHDETRNRFAAAVLAYEKSSPPEVNFTVKVNKDSKFTAEQP